MVISHTPCFNSRTPGGVRLEFKQEQIAAWKFQFTHPGRGATDRTLRDTVYLQVSIHAPREGCDSLSSLGTRSSSAFQFTHPGRGATQQLGRGQYPRQVSIHAPREGCDGILGQLYGFHIMFQFTHPGRGATSMPTSLGSTSGVSIHAPREGCDGFLVMAFEPFLVSIHAPREGGDIAYLSSPSERTSFNSRTPGGVRHHHPLSP